MHGVHIVVGCPYTRGVGLDGGVKVGFFHRSAALVDRFHRLGRNIQTDNPHAAGGHAGQHAGSCRFVADRVRQRHQHVSGEVAAFAVGTANASGMASGVLSAAAALRDTAVFKAFALDEWPTLVWPSGFDLSPEMLYERATGRTVAWLHEGSPKEMKHPSHA